MRIGNHCSGRFAARMTGFQPGHATELLPPPDGPPRPTIEITGSGSDRAPIKGTLGERVKVEAIVLAEGHDQLDCAVLYRESGGRWQSSAMVPGEEDRWVGSFIPDVLGRYEYTVEAWIDRYGSWLAAAEKRFAANVLMPVHLAVGAALITEAAAFAGGKPELEAAAEALRKDVPGAAIEAARSVEPLMKTLQPRGPVTRYEPAVSVQVERERARHGSWYELFPRSCGPADVHGTFADAGAWLPYVASMGFDIVYLPPIHPIGVTQRKGRNNSTTVEPGDPGSPWAIGSADGGHDAINPNLGTIDDFRRFVASAAEHGLEVALDIAFQCSPDHPWVTQHPAWFKHLPDGSIAYAENPPKRYEDIVPLNFESAEWRRLWVALRDVVLFWADEGIRTFRVDNPHTKPFPFWEWLITEVQAAHPDVIFLAEAFTRREVMRRLAMAGFSQSYTYFTWKNTKSEIIEFITELQAPGTRGFLRPNVWPNTPDILHEYLQDGGRPAFAVRFLLAATLAANYGIYGPAFELCESRPVVRGSEEYLDSEKYQLRSWDVTKTSGSLRPLITQVNNIRRAHPSLLNDSSLVFCETSSDQVIAYVKGEPAGERVLTVINLDLGKPTNGWVDLPAVPATPFGSVELLAGGTLAWDGTRANVSLNDPALPAIIVALR